MNGLAFEDMDEDLDEMDDEDVDEVLRENDDEHLAELRLPWRKKKKRGAKVKGGGYSPPRPPAQQNQTFVTQTQLQAALNRVGTDVRKLAASTSTIEKRVDQLAVHARRETQQTQQGLQMATLLPLLFRPKTVRLANAVDNIPAGTDVMIDSKDSFSTLLPLLLIGGLGGSGLTGTQAAPGQTGVGTDSTMLLVLAMMMSNR